MLTNYAGVIFYTEESRATPKPKATTVSASKPLVVTKHSSPGRDNYHVEYRTVVLPKIVLSVVPEILEVGDTREITYTGTVTPGSEDIVAVTMAPAGGAAVTDNKTTISHKVNVSAAVAGVVGQQTVAATDAEGNSVSDTKGVRVLHRYYTGFIPRNFLSTAALQLSDSGLGATIKAVFGAERRYLVPGAEGDYQHIAWLVPAGETMATPTGDGNFEYELAPPQNLVLTNDFGLELAYTLYYTKTPFSAGGEANLRIS